MKTCSICNLTKDNDNVIKYYNREICEECLEEVYNTTPKILNTYWIDDCFKDFA